jgi:hypothetical protein
MEFTPKARLNHIAFGRARADVLDWPKHSVGEQPRHGSVEMHFVSLSLSMEIQKL